MEDALENQSPATIILAEWRKRNEETRRNPQESFPVVPAALVAVWQFALGIHRAGQRTDQVTDQNHADHRNRNYVHLAPHPGSTRWPEPPFPEKYSSRLTL